MVIILKESIWSKFDFRISPQQINGPVLHLKRLRDFQVIQALLPRILSLESLYDKSRLIDSLHVGHFVIWGHVRTVGRGIEILMDDTYISLGV